MAERPIFVPVPDEPELVKEFYFWLRWHPGFAPVQKQKNVASLHAAAAAAGFEPLLEISSKSTEKVGQHLSAFHLNVRGQHGEMSLECAFQGSKVFEHGGPFTDLYGADVRDAKRDPRLRESGRLIGFDFEDIRFPLEPKTAFYDWLYINAIYPHREWLLLRLNRYAGFTDIEFNPERSVNCQARSCALFMSLMSKGLLETAIESPEAFIALITEHSYRPQQVEPDGQRALVSHYVAGERRRKS
ncbi:MAG TPA: hypothetical protein VN380_03595 [Thermoanaerobaculia bacterium]|jgi:hypothetical protein|nr:hypothetical protein [Thermoanaerobaculia bacterium]